MRRMLLKIKQWLAPHCPSKRRIIQLYAALLFNANIKGFASGRIYKGPTKALCAPGLNCYSCPGATSACPLGALQNSLINSNARLPYYIFGILLLYGLLFGRVICSFLCPFGLLQELLHKIKTPKLPKNRLTRALSHVKYLLLAVFVIGYPIGYMIVGGKLPAFCKYICPAGTLEGATALLAHAGNSAMFRMLGPLFSLKFVLLIAMLIGAVFIYRFFCRFFCPLGAIYGFFNRFSLLGVRVEHTQCIDCGQCISHCQMDIHHVGDRECIQCGECIAHCPTKAISWRGGRYVLAPNETGEKPDDNSRQIDRARTVRRLLAVLMALVMAAALVYYNVIDQSGMTGAPSDGLHGSEVGDLAYPMEIPLYQSEGGSFSLSQSDGRLTIVNFWGTWCGPCIAELPILEQIAADYAAHVTVLAVHSALDADAAPAFIAEHYSGSSMLFGQDTPTDDFYTLLGGKDLYPITVVLDEGGYVIARYDGDIDYTTLSSLIESNL